MIDGIGWAFLCFEASMVSAALVVGLIEIIRGWIHGDSNG